MTIEQKEWGIAEAVSDNWEVEHKGLEFAVAKHAARLGIIEGRRQAFEEAATVVHSEGHEGLAAAIRALIEEQKV